MLHIKVGEVAAAARRSATRNVNSSICFHAGATVAVREEFTLVRDRVCVCVCVWGGGVDTVSETVFGITLY